MPFSTTARDTNQNATNVANSIAKIFVGDPKADAAWRDQQIANETEVQRQKLLAEQTISEGVRRTQMEAAANASNAGARNSNSQAAGHERENGAFTELGNIFTNAPGGVVNMNDPATAARVTGALLRGNVDPSRAGAIALMPGQDNATLGRIFTAGGHTIGANQFVSTDDRNKNRTFNTNDRVVQGDGTVIAQPVPPGQGGGGKIPMLKQQDANSMIRSAILARGAQIAPDAQVASYFASQPQLYADLSRIVSEGWNNNGGNAAAVQTMLGDYLGNGSFEKFGGRTDTRMNPFSAETHQAFSPAMTVEQVLGIPASIPIPPELQAPPRGMDPNVFTGGQAPLPNLQNVGNGGWKVIGVQ